LDETTLLLLVQIISTIVLIATFLAYLLQISVMRKEITAMINVNQGTNTLELIKLLQEDGIREARRKLFALQDRALPSWTEDDRDNARAVCASYDVAATLARADIVNRDVVITTWGASIRKTFDLTRPLVEQMKAEYGTHWDNLQWLANQVASTGSKHVRRDGEPTSKAGS
jgi:hypothetical protein